MHHKLVIASAAKQSRIPPRKDSGLLRCARNDGGENESDSLLSCGSSLAHLRPPGTKFNAQQHSSNLRATPRPQLSRFRAGELLLRCGRSSLRAWLMALV